jgi:hypothetical protein
VRNAEYAHSQWPIIHGRLAGKPRAPSVAGFLCEAQLQRGECELRSLTACAFLVPEEILDRAGAVKSARGEGAPHAGQAHGALRSAIGRSASKGPQAPQPYS